MTGIGSTGWNPEHDLDVLLDAFTQDLLAASDRDVAMLVRQTGVPMDAVVQDMRRLVAAAETGPMVPPVADFASPGLRAYITRNQ
jgi:hypothetical protein